MQLHEIVSEYARRRAVSNAFNDEAQPAPLKHDQQPLPDSLAEKEQPAFERVAVAVAKKILEHKRVVRYLENPATDQQFSHFANVFILLAILLASPFEALKKDK